MQKKINLKVYPSYDCDMKCAYCEEDHQPDYLPISTLEQILSEYDDRLSNTVHLVGGEPSIYLQKVDYCEVLSKYFNCIKITTNLQSDYIFDICEKYNANLVVSWNGELDRSNKPIYGDALLNKIRKYKKYIELITIVVDNDNVTELYKLANFCYDECIKWEVIPRFSTKSSFNALDQNKLEFILRDLAQTETIMFCTQWIELLKYGHLTQCSDCIETSRCVLVNGEIYSCPIASPAFTKDENGWYKLPCNFNGYTNESRENYQTFTCGITNVFNKSLINRESLLFSKRLLLMLSDKCNLKCEYCFESSTIDLYKNGNIMTIETLKNVIRYIVTHDTQTVIRLFGGEPTMNLEGIKFLRTELESNVVLRRLVKELIITSNMYHLSDELVYEFNRLKLVSDFIVTVSIDTPPEIENKRIDLNGKQSGDMVISNLYKLRELSNSLYINVHFVVSKATYKYFDKMVEWLNSLYKSGIINEYEFGLIDPEHDVSQSLLNVDELKYISNYYWSHIVDHKEDHPVEFIKAFNIFKFDIVPEMENFDTPPFLVCQSGISDMAVDSYGYFIQCQRSTHRNSLNDYGKLNNINNTLYIKKKYIDRDVSNFKCDSKLCLSCKARKFCTICPTFNHNVTGDLYTQSEEMCNRAYYLMEVYNENKLKHVNSSIKRKIAIQRDMTQTILGYMIQLIEGVTK